MSLDWRDFPDAPAPATRLCAVDEIAYDNALTLDVAGFPVLVVLTPDGVRAFVNACPHQFLPLDHKGAQVLSADKSRLICSNHNAMFRVSDGQGTAGPGLDCRLSAIPVASENGYVVIGG